MGNVFNVGRVGNVGDIGEFGLIWRISPSRGICRLPCDYSRNKTEGGLCVICFRYPSVLFQGGIWRHLQINPGPACKEFLVRSSAPAGPIYVSTRKRKAPAPQYKKAMSGKRLPSHRIWAIAGANIATRRAYSPTRCIFHRVGGAISCYATPYSHA